MLPILRKICHAQSLHELAGQIILTSMYQTATSQWHHIWSYFRKDLDLFLPISSSLWTPTPFTAYDCNLLLASTKQWNSQSNITNTNLIQAYINNWRWYLKKSLFNLIIIPDFSTLSFLRYSKKGCVVNVHMTWRFPQNQNPEQRQHVQVSTSIDLKYNW